MAILSDHWIREMAEEHGMIEPFESGQVRDGAISYGTSSFGYDIRTSGLQPDAAEYGGVNAERTVVTTMTLSGMVAGLTGALFAIMILGYYSDPGTFPRFGFDAIAVSLLAAVALGALVGAVGAAGFFPLMLGNLYSREPNTFYMVLGVAAAVLAVELQRVQRGLHEPVLPHRRRAVDAGVELLGVTGAECGFGAVGDGRGAGDSGHACTIWMGVGTKKKRCQPRGDRAAAALQARGAPWRRLPYDGER